MNKRFKKLIYFSYFIVFLFAIGAFSVQGVVHEVDPVEQDHFRLQSASINEIKNDRIINLHPMFFDKVLFEKSIDKSEDIISESNIKAIIVPHYLLASDYIAGLLKQASGRKIENVVIVGPNHFNIGGSSSRIASTNAIWETPFGGLETNNDLVSRFISDTDCYSNLDAFTNEHSIGAIASFVKYYLDDVRIIPITFSSYANMENVDMVVNWLNKNREDNTLIIASIDFSHYLSKDQALKKDEITRNVILGKDLQKIMTLNNDYLDSPASLATVLKYADLNSLETEIVYHGNSFDFTFNKPSETTSYFGIVFK